MDKRIVDKLMNPGFRTIYFLKNLPGAYFFGLKITQLDDHKAVVSVPYRWSTKNPFKSIYFAALTAAAELSTGCIALAASYGKDVSTLVTGMEGKFSKKAKGTIFFTCEEVPLVTKAIDEAVIGSVGTGVTVHTVGKNEAGVEVARFSFQWSFKKQKV